MKGGLGASTSLTVEDRFLLKIAVKNGILSEEQVRSFVAQLAGEPGARAEERLIELGLLTKRQLDRLREAQAASQIVRLDTLYAAVVLEERLVAQEVVDAAFALQRKERFRARLGQILVERRAISLELHHKITSKVIRRLKRLGTEAYTSAVGVMPPTPPAALPPRAPLPPSPPTVPRAPTRTAAPPLPPRPLAPPPPSSTGPLFAPDERTAAAQSERAPALPQEPEPPRIPLDETQEAHSLFGRSSAYQARLDQLDDEGASDPFLASAIRIGLDSDQSLEFRRSDESVAEGDLAESKKLLDSGSISGRVLERVDMDTGSGSEEFDPEAYIQRKRRRAVVLRAVGGGVGVLALLALGTAGWALISNRSALGEVDALVARARAEGDPKERGQLFALAQQRLSGVGSFGVSRSPLEKAGAIIRWGALEARVSAVIAEGRALEAKGILASANPPAGASEEFAELKRVVEREICLQEAREAEEQGALDQAVLAYQRALPLGDPGGLARERLRTIREELDAEMQRAYEVALGSLAESDEKVFFQIAKRINDLYNEDPGAKERLSELRFRRCLRRGQEHSQGGRLAEARAEFETALEERPDDRGARKMLEQVIRRQEERSEEERGRALEERGDLEQAIASYRKAEEGASPTVRKRLAAAIARCGRKLRERDERLERNRRRLRSVALLKKSEIGEARELLKALDREGKDPRTSRLLEFTRKLDGMVYVPPGPFLRGSRRTKLSKPIERPQREVTLPGYFIDRTEVTNAAYARFVETGKASSPSHWDYAERLPGGAVRKTYAPALADHPLVNVSWAEARAYARWRGGDLPSEVQWEKAARGTDGRIFPWGDRYPARAHVQARPDPLRSYQTAPVGVHRDDASPFGVMDMAGNVNEWTLDVLQPYPDAPPSAKALPGRRVIRGGAYRWPFRDARCAARDSMQESYRSPYVGFRVVVPVPEDVDALR